jgi:hypothetical protein
MGPRSQEHREHAHNAVFAATISTIHAHLGHCLPRHDSHYGRLGVPPSRLGAADFCHAKAFAFFALGGRELAKFGSALLTPVNNGLASLHGVFVNDNVLYPKRADNRNNIQSHNLFYGS